MADTEWKNLGDINFTEYGGTMVRLKDDRAGSDSYEFFSLGIDDRGARYAYHGSVFDLKEDYGQAKCLVDLASERDHVSVEELLESEPHLCVAELVTGYGTGPYEFSARNIYGTGEYSMSREDFEVKSMDDLVTFMNDIDIPAQYIPDHTFKVVSKYGKIVVEDTLNTFDWDKAKDFAHEKLMSGYVVTMKDTRDGSEVELDPKEYAEKFNGEFPVNPDRRLEVEYEDDEIDRG